MEASPGPVSRSIARRNVWDQKGINIDESCNAQQQRQIKNVLENVDEFVSAAHDALNVADKKIFHYFFLASDYPRVSITLTNLHDRLNHLGAAAIIFCERPGTLSPICQRPGQTAWTEISTDRSTKESAIVLCPPFFTMRDLPKACDKSSLSLEVEDIVDNQAYRILWQLLRIPFITGSDVFSIGDLLHSAKACHALTTGLLEFQGLDDPPTTTNNVENYSLFAQWAFIVERQLQQCPTAFSEWGVLEPEDTSSRGVDLEWERDELRKLLSSGDGSAGVSECGSGAPCSELDKVLQKVNEGE